MSEAAEMHHPKQRFFSTDIEGFDLRAELTPG